MVLNEKPKTHQVRLDEAEWAEVQHEAALMGISAAEFMRRAILSALKKMEQFEK